jgi:hypothetical protein
VGANVLPIRAPEIALAGMLIAIPALGMLKVVFDRIPTLQPIGYLFGGEDIGDDQPGFFDKLISWTKDKITSGK